MSARFVRYFLRSRGVIGEFQRLEKGVTFKEITLEMLRKHPVLQPPVMEQSAIAEWLDIEIAKFRAVLDKTQATIHLLTEYRSALITNAVTGKIDVREAVQKEAAE